MTASEIAWKDEDGDEGHVVVGRDAVVAYLEDGVAADVVALVETRGVGEDVWTATLVPRAIAETLHNALGRELE